LAQVLGAWLDMSFNDLNYIIAPAESIEFVDFRRVRESNPTSVRYSLDGKYFLLKYVGEQPDFIYNITKDAVGLREYSHQEILEILQKPEWKT
tara:strand:- start:294 stop:572 length:279 start_codon:yes stop_codon:yes gene_type:complete